MPEAARPAAAAAGRFMPRRVVVAGDWHGDLAWACGIANLLPELLPHEPVRLILQAGDFGFAPGTWAIRRLSNVLSHNRGQLWFVDGNHEFWDDLAPYRDKGPLAQLEEAVFWARRGHRWHWHGRTWAAIGGAVSIDQSKLVATHDWWPEEELTIAEAEAIAAAGRAGVVLAHDCPAGVELNLPPVHKAIGFTPPVADLRLAGEHRRMMAALAAELQPSHWIHGHYHQAHDITADLGWGPLRVRGLDRNGRWEASYGVLNTVTMEWEH